MPTFGIHVQATDIEEFLFSVFAMDAGFHERGIHEEVCPACQAAAAVLGFPHRG
jgi:hypothetical protein